MNQQAVLLMGKQLDTLFEHLEKALGGDGNGIGLLYEAGETKVRKGVRFQAAQAAGEIRFGARLGASWALFHTRLATNACVAARTCHPFQYGKMVLAHNGHDHLFARLGAMTGKSDSASIAETWGRGHRSVASLWNRCGVFVGFQQGHPFVVKGLIQKDLVLAHHRETGALLFVSQLPDELRAHFDTCIDIGRLLWQGEPLILSEIERRPPPKAPQQKEQHTVSPLHVEAEALVSVS